MVNLPHDIAGLVEQTYSRSIAAEDLCDAGAAPEWVHALQGAEEELEKTKEDVYKRQELNSPRQRQCSATGDFLMQIGSETSYLGQPRHEKRPSTTFARVGPTMERFLTMKQDVYLRFC